MRSFSTPGLLASDYFLLTVEERDLRVRAEPLAARLRLGLQLIDRASAGLRPAYAEARELARAARSMAVPTAAEEQRSTTRHLLPLAIDVATTTYSVEAEAWLLEGRAELAEAPAAVARLLAPRGSGDPLVFGQLETMLALRAWLRSDLASALGHLRTAVWHYSEADDPRRQAEAWGRMALVLEQAGFPAEASEASDRARQLSALRNKPTAATWDQTQPGDLR